jgi:hypothetical protein
MDFGLVKIVTVAALLWVLGGLGGPKIADDGTNGPPPPPPIQQVQTAH